MQKTIAATKQFLQKFATGLTAVAVAGMVAGVAAASAAMAMPLLVATPAPLQEGVSRLMEIMGFAGKKKDKDDWGIVFDSETKRPLPGVVVSLMSEAGHVVDSALSDPHGRYGLLPNPGTYTLLAKRQDYALDTSGSENIVYGNVYAGGPVTVIENQIEKVNIALASTKINWQEFAKRTIDSYGSAFSVFKRDLLLVLYYSGFLISAGFAYLFPSPLNVFIFCVYICIFVGKLFFNQRSYGMITQAQTGKPVPFALVGVYDSEDPSRRLAFAVSDVLGRYYLLVENGAYLVKIAGNFLGGQRFEKMVTANVTDGIMKIDAQV